MIKTHLLSSSAFKAVAFLILGAGCLLSSPAAAQMHGTEESETTATVMGSQQSIQTTNAVNAAFDRLSLLSVELPAAGSGVSSGEMLKGVNLWINPYYTHSKDTNASTAYDGNTYGAFFGGDYKMNEALTLGLMLGVDNTDIESKVNGGGSDSIGLTISPYARYALNKTYSADMSFGYTTSESDNERFTAGSRIAGTSDSSRWFGAVGVNGSYWYDRWNFIGRVGTSMAKDTRDAYRESDGTNVAEQTSSFGQFQMGVTAGYYMEKVRPWASLTYAYDYERKLAAVDPAQVKPDNDRDQFILGVGATLFGYDKFVGDLSVKQNISKNNNSNTTLGFTVSAAF